MAVIWGGTELLQFLKIRNLIGFLKVHNTGIFRGIDSIFKILVL